MKSPDSASLPPTEFLSISPVLASADVARDIAWYEEKMDFSNVYDSSAYQAGPIDYAVLGRQKHFLHLQFQFLPDMTSTDVRFQVRHIEALLQELLASGALKPEHVYRKTAWNTTEGRLFDPSGNRITFFEDL